MRIAVETENVENKGYFMSFILTSLATHSSCHKTSLSLQSVCDIAIKSAK